MSCHNISIALICLKGNKKSLQIDKSLANDEKKENPCLVPYSQLPEREKDYDREMAVNTIKLLLKLGYEIKKR